MSEALLLLQPDKSVKNARPKTSIVFFNACIVKTPNEYIGNLVETCQD